MKNILTFTLLMAAASAQAQQGQLIPLLADSSHLYDFLDGTNASPATHYDYYTYNSELRLERYLEVFVNSMDIFFRRSDYVYDQDGRELEKTIVNSEESITGPWSNDYKSNTAYDNQGRVQHKLIYTSDGPNAWLPSIELQYGYDDLLRRDSFIERHWNASNGVWLNSFRKYNHYDAENRLVTSTADRAYQNEWKLSEVNHYTYLPNGKQQTHTSIYYYSNPSEFETTFDSTIYDANGQADTIYFKYMDQQFPESAYESITTFEYNNDGKLLFVYGYFRYYPEPEFHLKYRETHTPGDDVFSNEPKRIIVENYNPNTGSYELYRSQTAMYEAISGNYVKGTSEIVRYLNGIEDFKRLDTTWYRNATVRVSTPAPQKATICTFPNPFFNGDFISCIPANTSLPLNMRIVNLSGQTLAQARVTPGMDWRPAAIPPGIHFLEVWQENRLLGSWKVISVK